MKLHKQPERGSVGAYLSGLGGKILAGRKAREDTERNRTRLEAAALTSRELRLQRIADEEIKKLAASLVYEADGYILAARESDGAYYDPLVLDALDAARAAVNAWKKNENDAAAGKYLRVGGIPGGIVVPEEGAPGEYISGKNILREAGAGHIASNDDMRQRTIGILRESLRLFVVQNTIRTAGDPDAALAALAVQYPEAAGPSPAKTF